MIGQTLSHYHIVEELGRGSMGVVYKAEDTRLNRAVAIKLLAAQMVASDADRQRFYREARAAAALHHPNIATVFEIDETDEGHPFIVMEFIEGQPLDVGLDERPLPLEQAVALALQIAEALKAAHEKDIVHRDIKSANVMLTDTGRAKVLDFGLAKTTASTKLTQLGSTVGTVAYMSPEQAQGIEVDRRTDLWSLGVMLYEMISGQLPFPGDYEQSVMYGIANVEPEPLTGLRTGVPVALEQVVTKCLRKDRALRYQHADDLIADLRAIDRASLSGSRSLVSADRLAGAAVSDEGGGDSEVYLRPFPGPGAQIRISDGGGAWPRWREDGKELFYVNGEGYLVAVQVEFEGRPSVSQAEIVMADAIAVNQYNSAYPSFDVHPDGQRFLLQQYAAESGFSQLTILRDWVGMLEE